MQQQTQRKGKGLGLAFFHMKGKNTALSLVCLYDFSLPQASCINPLPPDILHYFHMDAEQVISYISFLFR